MFQNFSKLTSNHQFYKINSSIKELFCSLVPFTPSYPTTPLKTSLPRQDSDSK